MAYPAGRESLPPLYTEQVMRTVPLRCGEGPGEYESQYRPDVQSYHQDKKAPYGTAQPAQLPRDDHPNYKPGPLRWPLLCSMIVALLGLIAATEWACRILPVEDRQRPLPTTAMHSSATATSMTSALHLLRYRDAQVDAQTTTTTSPEAVSLSRNQSPQQRL